MACGARSAFNATSGRTRRALDAMADRMPGVVRPLFQTAHVVAGRERGSQGADARKEIDALHEVLLKVVKKHGAWWIEGMDGNQAMVRMSMK
jgi:hypothetical protein